MHPKKSFQHRCLSRHEIQALGIKVLLWNIFAHGMFWPLLKGPLEVNGTQFNNLFSAMGEVDGLWIIWIFPLSGLLLGYWFIAGVLNRISYDRVGDQILIQQGPLWRGRQALILDLKQISHFDSDEFDSRQLRIRIKWKNGKSSWLSSKLSHEDAQSCLAWLNKELTDLTLPLETVDPLKEAV
jgi:hypothetical protein